MSITYYCGDENNLANTKKIHKQEFVLYCYAFNRQKKLVCHLLFCPLPLPIFCPMKYFASFLSLMSDHIYLYYIPWITISH